MFRKRKLRKIIFALILIGITAFLIEANTPDHKKETPFLNLLHKESVLSFTPDGTFLPSITEHDGTKEPIKIAPEGASISNITNVYPVKQGVTRDQIIELFAQRAINDGWERITCEPGNEQCEGSIRDKKAFTKMIGDNKTQLWIFKTDRTTDSITVHAFALNVLDY